MTWRPDRITKSDQKSGCSHFKCVEELSQVAAVEHASEVATDRLRRPGCGCFQSAVWVSSKIYESHLRKSDHLCGARNSPSIFGKPHHYGGARRAARRRPTPPGPFRRDVHEVRPRASGMRCGRDSRDGRSMSRARSRPGTTARSPSGSRRSLGSPRPTGMPRSGPASGSGSWYAVPPASQASRAGRSSRHTGCAAPRSPWLWTPVALLGDVQDFA